MGNRKDIGKAFREKLKDFDQSPDDKVWGAIQADLQQKKKRRILPFWFTFAALNALLLGTVVVWNTTNDMDAPANPSIENRSGTNSNTHANPSDVDGKISNESMNTDQNPATQIESNPENPANSNNTANGQSIGKDVTEHNDSDGNDSPIGKSSAKKSNADQNAETDVATTEERRIGKKASKNKSSQTKFKPNRTLNGTELATRGGKTTRNVGGKKGKTRDENDPNKNGQESKAATALDSTTNNPLVSDFPLDTKPITQTNPKEGQTTTAQKETTPSETELSGAKPKTDSLANKTSDKKSAVKEALEKAKQQAKKLSLFVYGSPTVFGYQSKISPYDRRLDNNSLTSKTTLSYGAYAIYEASDRWSLRFGLGIINHKSETKDVTVNTLDYTGINYTNNSNVSIYAQSNDTKMDLIQEISYTEVPIELKYAIRTGKFGVNAFGGFSLRFLGKNDISAITTNGMRFDVGEAKFLSSNTFTINAGVGFDYKFARYVRLNIEPVFKYHLNDYKNVGVRPYSFGVLTGLQFSIK